MTARKESDLMANPTSVMAQQLAEAASSMEQERTGRTPRSVTVVLNDEMLVVTLIESMTPAERELAKTPAGAGIPQAVVYQYGRPIAS